MNKVSKELATKVTTDLRNDIAKVLAKHGLELSGVTTKYGDSFQIKIDAVSVNLGKNGVNLNSVDAQNFMNFGYSYGVTDVQADLGSEVSFGGKTIVITGLNPRKKNAPIVCKDIKSGNEYYVSADILKLLPSFSK
jgi:hypothetical protein